MSKQTSTRKSDHIELAFQSQSALAMLDDRFYYEPLLNPHPNIEKSDIDFLGKKLSLPIWISSMTGGTGAAKQINKNLAIACRDFKLGMGLGSCRIILDDDTYFEDFNLRPIIGNESPFYANLGIAQIEKSLENKSIESIQKMVDKLKADGLIIHVNPMQEILQPEGDKIMRTPLETIQEFLTKFSMPVIVKEVGQGMGPNSLKALMELPLQAIEFAAFGGTNFSKLEILRHNSENNSVMEPLIHIGHSAHQMVDFVNEIIASNKNILVKEFIISGGIQNFLDGYYLMNKLKTKSVYGQASAMLKQAAISADSILEFLSFQQKGLAIAEQYLRIR